jgi:hypothetical protein
MRLVIGPGAAVAPSMPFNTARPGEVGSGVTGTSPERWQVIFFAYRHRKLLRKTAVLPMLRFARKNMGTGA